MIDKGYITLLCDAAEHEDEDQEPYGLDYGFKEGEEAALRRKACEDGWTSVRLPGAPWRWEDRCREHPGQPPQTPDDLVQVRA